MGPTPGARPIANDLGFPTQEDKRMSPMRRIRLSSVPAVIILLAVQVASGATAKGSLAFTNTQLLRPDGTSEPEIRGRADGTMAMVGLSWQEFVTHLWSGPFGSTPAFRGEVDSALQLPGRREVFGGGDADVDLASTGTLHATTLIFLTPPTLRSFQLGVSAITCPNPTASGFVVPDDCTSQIIDTAGADRSWITSDGPRVYISYHDAGNSSLIHVQRSDDDGSTWTKVGDPVGDQGVTWSPAMAVNVSPANTAVFPWLAAYNGTVDLVYYGTKASSKDDPSAVWNVYLAQTTDGQNFTQSRVSKTANHVGVICTNG